MRAAVFSLMLPVAVQASPLFDDTGLLELRLEGPIETVIDDRRDPEQLPFTLKHDGARFEIKVRVRGKSRRRVCDFPPLRLNFREDAASPFQGQDKLKLVTHCRDTRSAEKNVLEEFAVYRMFNVLTEQSLRVRLVRIDYAGDGRSRGPHYGFLLEPEEHIASRLGATLLRQAGVTRSSLDESQAALVYIFAYLIGNTDWSLVTAELDTECCHNGILLESAAGRTLLVPYDFDLSGLVNASYAKPDPRLGLRNVTIRRYRGYCTTDAALSNALQHIVAHRDELLQVIDTLPLLSDRDKASRKRYLQRFFKEATKPDRLLRMFARRCL